MIFVPRVHPLLPGQTQNPDAFAKNPNVYRVGATQLPPIAFDEGDQRYHFTGTERDVMVVPGPQCGSMDGYASHGICTL